MRRDQLEHILRAASRITKEREFVIVGSQSILGKIPRAPEKFLCSIEVDIYPKNNPAKAEEIDGAIGELSIFHETHGYYAHGVGPETSTLPKGWEKRLIQIKNTEDIIGWCLDPHDLAYSKLAANRPKDRAFVRNLLAHRFIKISLMEKFIGTTPGKLKELLRERWERIIAASKKKK